MSGREMLDSPSEIGTDSSCLLVFVKEHTRGFRETNFNVTKSIMELFLALCDYHEKATCPFPKWAAADGATLCADKIADKKLSALSKALLTALCVVEAPHHVLDKGYGAVKKIRAPAAHEEFLNWFKSFLNDFGASSVGQGLAETVTFLAEVRHFSREVMSFFFFLLANSSLIPIGWKKTRCVGLQYTFRNVIPRM